MRAADSFGGIVTGLLQVMVMNYNRHLVKVPKLPSTPTGIPCCLMGTVYLVGRPKQTAFSTKLHKIRLRSSEPYGTIASVYAALGLAIASVRFLDIGSLPTPIL